jgi:hypothetical protein
MSGDDQGDTATGHEAVADAGREAAAALARLAGEAVRYADARIAEETAAAAASGLPRVKRAKPGEFVADELAVMLREQPYQVRCLLARSRRLASGLPTVWEAFQCPPRPDLRHQHGPVLPKAPPGQNLRLAGPYQRRPRRRLDHARRRNLPMRGRTPSPRTRRLTQRPLGSGVLWEAQVQATVAWIQPA